MFELPARFAQYRVRSNSGTWARTTTHHDVGSAPFEPGTSARSPPAPARPRRRSRRRQASRSPTGCERARPGREGEVGVLEPERREGHPDPEHGERQGVRALAPSDRGTARSSRWRRTRWRTRRAGAPSRSSDPGRVRTAASSSSSSVTAGADSIELTGPPSGEPDSTPSTIRASPKVHSLARRRGSPSLPPRRRTEEAFESAGDVVDARVGEDAARPRPERARGCRRRSSPRTRPAHGHRLQERVREPLALSRSGRRRAPRPDRGPRILEAANSTDPERELGGEPPHAGLLGTGASEDRARTADPLADAGERSQEAVVTLDRVQVRHDRDRRRVPGGGGTGANRSVSTPVGDDLDHRCGGVVLRLRREVPRVADQQVGAAVREPEDRPERCDGATMRSRAPGVRRRSGPLEASTRPPPPRRGRDARARGRCRAHGSPAAAGSGPSGSEAAARASRPSGPTRTGQFGEAVAARVRRSSRPRRDGRSDPRRGRSARPAGARCRRSRGSGSRGGPATPTRLRAGRRPSAGRASRRACRRRAARDGRPRRSPPTNAR